MIWRSPGGHPRAETRRDWKAFRAAPRRGERPCFARNLLPVDIAEPEIAKEAIEPAVSVAKAFNSDIRLIHVTSPIVIASPMAVIPQSVYDELGVYEKAELERMAASIDRPKGTVATVVRMAAFIPNCSPRPRNGRPISSSWARTSDRWRPISWARAPPPSFATRPAR